MQMTASQPYIRGKPRGIVARITCGDLQVHGCSVPREASFTSMRQFCQAILDMVEVGGLPEIESLADRLRPYRVETYNTAASKLKLVLENDLPNR